MRYVHGMANTPIYHCWSHMKQRCYNPNDKAYKDYGGRGITMDESWKESFINFYNDMGDKPGKDCDLDRINNEEGYYKDNCRWIDHKTNMNNTRKQKNCKRYVINNREYSMREITQLSGVNESSIRKRMKRGIRENDLLKPAQSNFTDTH